MIDKNNGKFGLESGQNQAFKMVVLGAKGCGKTSLIRRFVTCEFSEDYRPTVGVNIYNTTVTINGNRLYSVQIIDSIPMDNFPTDNDEEWRCGALLRYGIRSAQVYLIVFDLADHASYKHAHKLAQQIVLSRMDAKIVFCGAKYDLLQGDDSKCAVGSLLPFNKKRLRKDVIRNGYRTLENQFVVSGTLPPTRKVVNKAERVDFLRRKTLSVPSISIVEQHARSMTEIARSSEQLSGSHRFSHQSIGEHSAQVSPSHTGSFRRRFTFRSGSVRKNNTNNAPLLPTMFVACSAKYNWRVMAVFKEVVDTFERRPRPVRSRSPTPQRRPPSVIDFGHRPIHAPSMTSLTSSSSRSLLAAASGTEISAPPRAQRRKRRTQTSVQRNALVIANERRSSSYADNNCVLQ